MKSANKEDCLLCLNPTWTWYEVLRECCGTTPLDKTMTRLCTDCQPKLSQQLNDKIKETDKMVKNTFF